MTADQIQALLPPIVLSLGAILPFLVASPPFAVADNARTLLMCIMTLFIWLGYWVAYSFGAWAFASLQLTAVLIVAALIAFIAIFFVAQRPSPKKPESKAVNVNSGETRASIDNPVWLWIYLLGLLTVGVAAALYVGPKDWVIVEFQLPDDQGVGKVTRISKVVSGPSVNLDPIESKGITSVMLPKAEFDAVKKFIVTIRSGAAPVNQSPVREYDAFPENKGELLRPGLGKYYRIPLKHD